MIALCGVSSAAGVSSAHWKNLHSLGEKRLTHPKKGRPMLPFLFVRTVRVTHKTPQWQFGVAIVTGARVVAMRCAGGPPSSSLSQSEPWRFVRLADASDVLVLGGGLGVA